MQTATPEESCQSDGSVNEDEEEAGTLDVELPYAIGYPCVLLTDMEEDDGVTGTTAELCAGPVGADPIGYPCVLCLFSYIMWTMQTVGLLLKGIGFCWSIYLVKTYVGLGYWTSSARVPPDPPMTKKDRKIVAATKKDGRKHLLHLGLMAAVAVMCATPMVHHGVIIPCLWP